MLLSCPACGARYDAPDAAIPSTGRGVRCSACRAEWLARPSAAVPVADEPAHAAQPGDAPSVANRRSSPERAPERREEPVSEPASPGSGAEPMIASLSDDRPSASGRGGAAFMAGFALVALLALGAAGVYLRHGEIAAAAPGLAGPLDDYVAIVDSGRARLARIAAEIAPGE